MNLPHFLKTWEGAVAENRTHRITLPVLALAALIGAIGSCQRQPTVVLVPPTLEERAVVDANASSEEAQVAWALYLATLIGNTTPDSAGFLKDALPRYLSPGMQGPVMEAVTGQVEQIQTESISLQFIPKIARFEPSIGRVVVTGDFVMRGVRGSTKRSTRSYEMGFVTQNYRVLLDSLRVTEGPWRAESAS